MSGKLPLTEVLAARLAEARQVRGYSQRGLGQRMGLSKAQGSARVNRYEHGTTFLTMATLDALANALDVPRASLLADTGPIAQAIRLLAQFEEAQQARLVMALAKLVDDPALLSTVLQTAVPQD